MAYIQPNSTVLLLKGVSLDKDYNHTIYWSAPSVQFETLASPRYIKYRFEKQTYQRVNRNSIKLQVLADNIYDCNYMMFQNTAYGNKWFYAFINEVNYINDKTTEVVYTIDDMQTWYFDYELGKCFVEREHTLTDEIGENLVPEPMDVGEYTYYNEKSLGFSGIYFAGVVLSKPFGTGGTPPVDYMPELTEIWGVNPAYGAPCGVANGLYIYGGFPIDPQSLSAYQGGGYRSSLQGARGKFADVTSFQKIVELISSGEIEGFDESAIVTTFQAPIEFFSNTISTLSYPCCSTSIPLYLERPSSFKDITSQNEYVPYNKKMLTYPFIKCACTTQQGSVAEYKFEDFEWYGVAPYPAGAVLLEWVGVIFPQTQIFAYPIKYKKLQKCLDEGVSLQGAPLPAWAGDKYGAWVNQHSSSANFAILASALRSGMAIPSLGADLPFAATNLATSIGSIIARVKDISRTPPSAYLQAGNNNVPWALKEFTIKLQSQTMKYQNAKIADEYLSMFGYAINSVKIPNVRDINSMGSLRPLWNYIKTKGCIIHPAPNSGLPSDSEANIARIYDKGITFWMSDTDIGNYNFAGNVAGG